MHLNSSNHADLSKKLDYDSHTGKLSQDCNEVLKDTTAELRLNTVSNLDKADMTSNNFIKNKKKSNHYIYHGIVSKTKLVGQDHLIDKTDKIISNLELKSKQVYNYNLKTIGDKKDSKNPGSFVTARRSSGGFKYKYQNNTNLYMTDGNQAWSHLFKKKNLENKEANNSYNEIFKTGKSSVIGGQKSLENRTTTHTFTSKYPKLESDRSSNIHKYFDRFINKKRVNDEAYLSGATFTNGNNYSYLTNKEITNDKPINEINNEYAASSPRKEYNQPLENKTKHQKNPTYNNANPLRASTGILGQTGPVASEVDDRLKKRGNTGIMISESKKESFVTYANVPATDFDISDKNLSTMQKSVSNKDLFNIYQQKVKNAASYMNKVFFS